MNKYYNSIHKLCYTANQATNWYTKYAIKIFYRGLPWLFRYLIHLLISYTLMMNIQEDNNKIIIGMLWLIIKFYTFFRKKSMKEWLTEWMNNTKRIHLYLSIIQVNLEFIMIKSLKDNNKDDSKTNVKCNNQQKWVNPF